jgi:hypothetical protein
MLALRIGRYVRRDSGEKLGIAGMGEGAAVSKDL